MIKANLQRVAGISPNTMTCLRRDEKVFMGVLNASIGDIMDLIPVANAVSEE